MIISLRTFQTGSYFQISFGEGGRRVGISALVLWLSETLGFVFRVTQLLGRFSLLSYYTADNRTMSHRMAHLVRNLCLYNLSPLSFLLLVTLSLLITLTYIFYVCHPVVFPITAPSTHLITGKVTYQSLWLKLFSYYFINIEDVERCLVLFVFSHLPAIFF